MVDKVLKPGVEIIQKFQGTPPQPTSPQLIPCVVGPAFEVLKSTNSDGSLNDSARQLTAYSQMPRVISPSDFPAPRGNGDELNFLENEIKIDLLIGGKLKSLARDPGEAFLKSSNIATRAGLLLTDVVAPADGSTFVVSVDQPVAANVASDVTVTFDAAGDIDEVISQINAGIGFDLAVKVRYNNADALLLLSPTFGASSSITIRKWGTSNAALGLDATMNYRLEGSGYRVQDDLDRDTTSAWIEFYAGNYFESANNQLPTPEDNLTPVLGEIEPLLFGEAAEVVEYDAGADDTISGYLSAKPSDLVWTGGAAHAPIKAATPTTRGDLFVADGVAPQGAQIIRVEAGRFKLGVVDTVNSTYDSDGNAVNQVYLPVELNTMLGRPPFAPRHVWFQARNLIGNEVNTAATMLGSREGAAATPASIPTGNAVGEDTVGIGHTTVFVVTEDGVEREEEVLVWTGSYATRAEMVADFENLKAAQHVLEGVIATESGGTITFETVKTGKDQALAIMPAGTGNAILGFSILAASTSTGTDVMYVSNAPSISFTPASYANDALAGQEFTIVVYDLNGVHTINGTLPNGVGPANIAELVAAINALDVFTDNGNVVFEDAVVDGAAVKLVATQPNSRIVATAATTDNATFGIANTSVYGYAGLTGETLRFKLDNNPFIYEATFATDSLNDAVDDINALVGANVASISGDNARQIRLTSLMNGLASKVEVLDIETVFDDATDATGGNAPARALGLTQAAISGTGRPSADLVVSSLLGTVSIGGQIVRNQITGEPLNSNSVLSGVYFSYRALRLDVSSEAADPGLLKISSFASLESDLGPISTENPLALGIYFALANAGEGVEVSAIGVSDISGSEPEGTALSYAKAFDFLRSHEVYCVVPLSHKEEVISLADTHVKDMSEPANRRERVVLTSPKNPLRRPSTVILSSEGGNTTGTPGQFDLNDNPGESLVTNGVNPSQAIPFELADSRQVYLEMMIDDVVRRYSVSSISGSIVSLRSSVSAANNLDGFYTVGVFNEDLATQPFTLAIRGKKLLLPGTTKLDKTAYAETIRDIAQGYANRRQLRLYPDTVTAVIDGRDNLIASYFFGCGLAGLAANTGAQEAFSRRSVPGFSGVSGPKLEERHYDIISAGNAVIEQETPGGLLSLRLQATTDVSTIESREWSITKAIDAYAKLLRSGLRSRTGPFNITKAYLDESSTVIDGINKFAEEIGLLKSASINNLVQDIDHPDTIAVDITAEVFFPANYIRVTILV